MDCRLLPAAVGLVLSLLGGALLGGTLSGCAAGGAAGSVSPVMPGRTADLVLRGGTILTVDDVLGEREALAVCGDRIIAVGARREIERLIGPDTEIVELDGRVAIPGFIEGHGHFMGVGEAAQNLDLMHVRNWDDVIRMVAAAAAAAAPGEWIVGRGWHQEKWDRVPENAVEGFPTHHAISSVSPDNPVALTHASGHAAFFNQQAMELAGISRDTRDPAGGEILRDAQGEPIGVFRETAQGLVSGVRQAAELRRSPTQIAAARRRTALLADRACAVHGITSFQDAGSSLETVDFLKELATEGALQTRLWVMIRDRNARLAGRLDGYRLIGHADNHLTVRALKRSIDGALGPRGAWLLEPYADSPDSTGLNTATIEDVTEMARLAAEHGFQACVHAIGDRANREVLDIFERALAEHGLRDARWRIEHAQHLSPADIPRFGQLGVIASMQGIHCTSDAPYVLARLGEQRAEEGAYVWQKLLRSGAVVTNGTDAPVEAIDPLASYHATVTRQLADGSVFFPEQRMSRMEALRSYTLSAAYAAFEDDIKGSLVPGKLADIVVLSQDITRVPADRILDTEVDYTIVGGEIVYRRGEDEAR